MTTAQGIIELRHALELTQPQLADLLGVGFRSLCRWEVGGRLTSAALSKLAKFAREKKVDHLANFFRSMHQAEIVTKINKLGTAGSPRSITQTELQQWAQTLSKAFFGFNSALKSQRDRMEPGAFYVMCDYVNMVEDVRSYISHYAGPHDDASPVRPFGSWVQADEAQKNPPPKVPPKRGRPRKTAAATKARKPRKA